MYWKSWERRWFHVEVLKLLFMTIWRFLRYLHDGYQELPRSLTAQDRILRVTSSQEFLDLFTSEQDKFVRHIVTGDETWIHHWNPESKQESMQWRHASSSPPSKIKLQTSVGKIMATIFWNRKGVLLIDYLPDKTTMNGQYYANLCWSCAKQSRINTCLLYTSPSPRD